MTKIEVYNNSDGSDMIEAVSLEEVAKVIDEIENQIISTVFTRCKIYSKNCFHCKALADEGEFRNNEFDSSCVDENLEVEVTE